MPTIHDATRNGDAATVVELLKADQTLVHCKDEHYGVTPTAWAAYKGCHDIMELLLAARADPIATNKTGTTPGHWAALSGSEVCMEKLLFHRATPNAADTYGWTACHEAAKNNSVAVLQLLISEEQILT